MFLYSFSGVFVGLYVYFTYQMLLSEATDFWKQGEMITGGRWGVKGFIRGPTVKSLCRPQDFSQQPSDRRHSTLNPTRRATHRTWTGENEHDSSVFLCPCNLVAVSEIPTFASRCETPCEVSASSAIACSHCESPAVLQYEARIGLLFCRFVNMRDVLYTPLLVADR